MSYTPRNVPNDPALIPEFLRQELQRLAQAMGEQQPLLRLARTEAAPDKARAGDLRYADGTNWDPDGGTAEGIYWFDGTDWHQL